MKLYYELDLENLEKIQEEIIKLNQNLSSVFGFHELEKLLESEFISEALPTLVNSINKINFTIKEAELSCFRKIGKRIIREFINPSTSMRLLVPVKNFKDFNLNFYESDEKTKLYGYHRNEETWNLCKETSSRLIDTIKIKNCLLYRVTVPHNFSIENYSKLPVIMLNVTVNEEYQDGS
jgi:hypothetical protein